MSGTLPKALLVVAVGGGLLAASTVRFHKAPSLSAWLQLGGAAAVLIVGATHVAEALQLLPWMGWGLQHSAGHYLDLSAAIIGVTLLPVGYLLGKLRRRHNLNRRK